MRIGTGVFSRAGLALALLAAQGSASAGGFAINTQSTSALGNAFAGSASAAEDASTIWYNPAGMVRLQGTQISLTAHAINTSFKYHDGGSTGAFASPGTGEGGDGGGLAIVPQAYASFSVGDKWKLGIAFNTPFGLKTEYDSGWRGQITALKSEVQAYNLNPSVAYAIDKTWSVGAGVSYQRISTELTNFAGAAGVAKLEADDAGWGYNLGVLYNASETTRVGLAYRSRIAYTLMGTASASAVPGSNGAQADLTVPESVSLSAFSAVSPRWDVMAGAIWTRWDRLQSLTVTSTSGGVPITTLPFKWRNTTLLAVGANYKPSDAWKLRAGVAYDPAVSNDETRTARLPDQSRWVLSVGGRYTAGRNDSFDFAYSHDFIKDANINNVTAIGTLTGTFKSSADVLSAQYNHQF
jgi:long-chain fatty acid transport protein